MRCPGCGADFTLTTTLEPVLTSKQEVPPPPVAPAVEPLPVLSFPVGTELAEVELAMIRATLDRVGGNKNLCAQLLGVSARSLYRKLKGAPERCRWCSSVDGVPHVTLYDCLTALNRDKARRDLRVSEVEQGGSKGGGSKS